MKALKKYELMIAGISDERNNGDGVWVYLKKEWADFDFDPFHPTRQIHEETPAEIVKRLRAVRKIADQDFYNHPHLRY